MPRFGTLSALTYLGSWLRFSAGRPMAAWTSASICHGKEQAGEDKDSAHTCQRSPHTCVHGEFKSCTLPSDVPVGLPRVGRRGGHAIRPSTRLAVPVRVRTCGFVRGGCAGPRHVDRCRVGVWQCPPACARGGEVVGGVVASQVRVLTFNWEAPKFEFVIARSAAPPVSARPPAQSPRVGLPLST